MKISRHCQIRQIQVLVDAYSSIFTWNWNDSKHEFLRRLWLEVKFLRKLTLFLKISPKIVDFLLTHLPSAIIIAARCLSDYLYISIQNEQWPEALRPAAASNWKKWIVYAIDCFHPMVRWMLHCNLVLKASASSWSQLSTGFHTVRSRNWRFVTRRRAIDG